MKFVEVKEWFVVKNNLHDCHFTGVLKITEKAVLVTMADGFKTTSHWIPKSCLEIIEDEFLNTSCYKNVEGMTMEEALNCQISTFEIEAKNNAFVYSLYL